MPFLLTRKKTWERLWKNTVSSKNNSCIQGLFYKSFLIGQGKESWKSLCVIKCQSLPLKWKPLVTLEVMALYGPFLWRNQNVPFVSFSAWEEACLVFSAWLEVEVRWKMEVHHPPFPSPLFLKKITILQFIVLFWIIFIDVPSDQISTSGP